MSYNLPHDPDVDGPAVWQRQADEPKLHYEWFHVYLLLGPGRSMRAAYNQFQAQKSLASSKVIKSQHNLAVSKSWSGVATLWKWVERADAWDRNQRIVEEFEREQWNRKMGQRAETAIEQLLAQSDDLQKFGEKMLSWPLYQTTSINDGQTIIIEPSRWTMDTGVRMILAQCKLAESALKLYVELCDLRARDAARSQDATAEALMNRAMRALEAVEGENAGKPLTPTQQRERENALLNALEASLLAKAQRGAPGAIERILRVAQRRARLNGLDKPFDPNAEVKTKKRHDLSGYSQAELDILEELIFRDGYEEEDEN